MKDKKRVLVIGLDCATPQLLFDKFKDKLPNISRLMENGAYGKLRSVTPPITIPAWLSMMTGKNPGKLGLYGFRHRRDGSYRDMWIADSKALGGGTVWDILGKNGKKSCLVAFPPSYPPRKINGWMVSCFLTPDISRPYTYPKLLKHEIEQNVGEYIPDVPFRVDEKEELLKNIYKMTESRFKLVNYLIKEKDWDLFTFVEIGLDRIHHAYWRYFDSRHHLYEPNSPFKKAIEKYYKYLDKKVGEIVSAVPEDTFITIVSDHGAKGMKGAICINDWLIDNGYLVLKKEPKEVASLHKTEVDWKKTKAWAWGGYYSRVFVNVEGREPSGVIPKRKYERFRNKLSRKLKKIKGMNNEKLDTLVYKPEEIYPVLNGDYPDLMVFFDDMSYRAAGTIGHPSIYLKENDTGPDDAVHDWDGVFVAYHPGLKYRGEINNLYLQDIAPTLLSLFGAKIPEDIDGKIIKEVVV